MSARSARRSPQGRRRSAKINLALQGGGGHGAFAWGVLDRLLETNAFAFEAISSTSGGAMNTVVLVDAIENGGPERARQQLERLWRGISEQRTMLAADEEFTHSIYRQWRQGSFGQGGLFQDFFSTLPPDSFSMLETNPLEEVLDSLVDFDRLRLGKKTKLFISATNVRTGRTRVFHRDEMTIPVIIASGCLPYLFQAVKIEDQPYWDGGFSGNPPLWPFFRHADANDILLVQQYPATRQHVPTKPEHILERMNEIVFNNSLLQELRAIDFVDRLIEEGHLDAQEYSPHRIHRIGPPSSALRHHEIHWTDDSWANFLELRDAGRDAADAWLSDHAQDVGHRSSFDLRAEFA